MISHEYLIRVLYADTDQMGYVYHGVFPRYLEAARTEMIREMGIVYRDMETGGVMMPVVKMSFKFLRPAKYDDLLKIKTMIHEVPDRFLDLKYEIYNEENALLVTANVVLTFVSKETMRSVRAPEEMKALFSKNMA